MQANGSGLAYTYWAGVAVVFILAACANEHSSLTHNPDAIAGSSSPTTTTPTAISARTNAAGNSQNPSVTLKSVAIKQDAAANNTQLFPGPGSRVQWEQACAISNRGTDAFLLKHYGQAEKLFSSAITTYGYEPSFYFNLGNALKKQKKLKEAIQAYAQAVKINPKKFEYTYMLGTAYFEGGKYKEAKEAFRQAARLDCPPKYISSLNWYIKECDLKAQIIDVS